MTLLLGLVALVSLVVVGFISFSEGALLSADRRLLKQKADDGSRAAAQTLDVASRPEILHGTLLFTLNLFLIIFALAGEELLTPWLRASLGALPPRAFHLAVFLGSVLILDGVVLLWGEILPKTWAISDVARNALRIGPSIHTLGRLMKPIATALYILPAAMLGSRSKAHAPLLITEEQLRIALDLGSSAGVIEVTESELGQKVMDAAETTVDQVMTLRQDIFDLPAEMTVKEVLEAIKSVSYSRIPLYRAGDDDDLIGILNVKDLMSAYLSEGLDRPVGDWARPVLFIPEKKKVFDLLLDFKSSRSPLALAVDEAGSLTGLVTLEDCLEEVVGEIYDEHDQPEATYKQVDEDTYIVDGRMELTALEELLGLDLPDEDYQTIGGLVMGLVGHVPTTGTKVRQDPWTMTVMRMVGRRIDRVRVARRKPSEPPPPAA